MITKDQASQLLEDKLANYRSMSFEDIKSTINDHFKLLMTNYDHLDDELKEICNKYLQSMLELAEKNISKMPEGLEKIKSQRLLKRANYKNFDATQLVKILENRNSYNKSILDDTREIFISTLQNIIDFLSDITEQSMRGIYHFAMLSLFYLIIDELLTAFHLSQHSFVTQGFTHIRTITEELNKIRLFNREPKWAELWISDKPEDKKVIIKELSPSSVRTKLGGEKFDPIYNLLSELGPHGAYKSIWARSVTEIHTSNPDKLKAQLWIGGCPLKHNVVFLNSFLIKILGEVLFEITNIYESSLKNEEVEDALDSFMNSVKEYNLKHFVQYAKSEGFDVNPLINMLNKEPWV